MNAHALERLEFNRVREKVVAWCRSESGNSRLSGENPSSDPRVVNRLQDDVAAFRQALEEEDLPGEAVFPGIGETLQRVAKEGAVLEAIELTQLARFARASGRLQRFLMKRLPAGRLREQSAALPDLAPFHKEIGRYIDVRGELLERHIPELKRLSAAIRSAQSSVERVAGEYMQRRGSDYWNVDHPVVREGRIVLPLKARYQSRVEGVVHEHSQTGQTVFVEPAELLRANNELRGAQDRYRQEVFRILKELSTLARRYRSELADAEEIITDLDTVYARTRYSQAMDGVRPESSQGDVRLPQIRHPLIGPDVVPIDVRMVEDTRHLIVTGPNTGGKTVALKTIGLAAYMYQFGLQIPALPGAVLPVFDDVFADIGDEQSLEQSLSTFSGHMRQISLILTEASAESLVLLDELGAGTDPAEGGALAMAILDELRDRACHSVVTTHHGALKSYGYTHEQLRNASVEFNVESLSPTYRLLTGVPGSSHGITIAQRNGIPDGVIERASEYAEEGRGDTARIIERLGDEEKRIQQEAEDLGRRRRAVERKEEELSRRSGELTEQERRLREQELGEFQRFAAEARSRLENLVRELREGEITREKTKKVRQFAEELEQAARREDHRIEDLGQVASDVEPKASQPGESSSVPIRDELHRAHPGSYEAGMEVLLKSTRRRAVLQRRAKRGQWVVATDSVKLTVTEEEIEPVAGRSTMAEPTVHIEQVPGGPPAAYELDVRGKSLAEALSVVDGQIDRAVMNGLQRFSIIHGKGTGVLQRGVREHLESSPIVNSISYAKPEEGGYGKTIVELARE